MSRVLSIAGKRWLAGMSWRSYDRPPARALIKAEARASKANAYVQRTGTLRTLTGIEPRYDVGYANIGKEILKGQIFSLGATIAAARPGPWAGIFKLSDALYYYIAVDANGAIIPDQYGEYVGSAEQVGEARQTHASLAEAAFIDGDLDTLEKFIQESPGLLEKIRPVSASLQINFLKLIPFAVIAVLALGGYEVYRYRELQLKQAQEAARLAAILAAKNKHPPISPLLKAMPAGDWLRLCDPQRWRLPYVENGWSLRQYECLSTDVVLTWVRGPGASTVVRPPGTLTPNGNTLTQLIPLGVEFKPKSTRAPSIPSFQDERAELQAWAEQVGFTVQFGPISNVESFNLKQAQVTIDSPLVPWSLVSLNRVEGLRLNAFNSTQGGAWVLKGVLYGSYRIH